MVTSESNSVIDSVFHHLIRLGYERIIRIADLDKIDRSLLPYALHALGGTQEHTKKLQKMLQSSNQSMPGNHYIHKSLNLVRGGSPKRLLHNATVVGASCRDALSSCIGSYDFPIVIIDDATETPELSSLLPLAKFGVQKLLLGGDSGRLTNQEAGFSQSLFSRLNKSSENSAKLTTQYRCHNDVIDVINNAFYDDVIISGMSSSDRPKVVAGLPNFCFYDVTGTSGNNEQHNPQEALFVADIIRLLMSHGVPGTSVVVITTDQTQVKQVQSALQEIE
uniref:DNA2/NAM7 helicase-like C-terminal domain-containing protein n=1 Tax=Ciona savignyi TaxID=51511 RepID=H2ZR24_CIOSA